MPQDNRSIDSPVQPCACVTHDFDLTLCGAPDVSPRPTWWPVDNGSAYSGESMSIALGGVDVRQTLSGVLRRDGDTARGSQGAVRQVLRRRAHGYRATHEPPGRLTRRTTHAHMAVKQVPWQSVDDPVAGLATNPSHAVQVRREAIPIIFVPGVMGSRLRLSGTEARARPTGCRTCAGIPRPDSCSRTFPE
jgi:hypothetical protein